MAVYIRFADSEGVSPIIVGEMITPSRYNWNSTTGQDATGDVVSGTSLFSWWYNYDMGFQNFYDNVFTAGQVGQAYTKSWKLYADESYKLQFKFTIQSFGRYAIFEIYVIDSNNNNVRYYPSIQGYYFLTGYPSYFPQALKEDFLNGYGPTLVCTPHVQNVPDSVAIVFNFSVNMANYIWPSGRMSNFFSFYL